jgi:DNA-binding response OmpR family regulator
MFPPADPMRRRFLTVAAGGAVAAAASATTAQAPDATDLLRVGSLELDLTNRTARRGDRSFDLRPCEFRLLKYMMQRSGQLVTRANLFVDVWHYKFVPETNLLDVHMGLLRRKVDGSNEAPMIRNVRGAGWFIPNVTDQRRVDCIAKVHRGRRTASQSAGRDEFDFNATVGDSV